MKIFVLGAGRMGSIVAKDLSSSRSDIELGVGDIDRQRAEALATQNESREAFAVDVTNVEKLSEILRGYDVVVNASWYAYNLYAMRACLNAKCSYNDLGGLFHTTREQLKLDAEAKSNGISAIVGGGESPGITNVMSYFGAQGMSQVDSVKIFVGAKDLTPGNGVTFPFSPSTVIDEYTKNPVEFIDGKFVELPPLSGDELVTFPEPVGQNVCHYSIHSEPATLPQSIGRGIRSVEFKLGISEKMIKLLSPLIEVGMVSEGPKVPVNGTSISPREFLVSFFNSRSAGEEANGRTAALRTLVVGTLSGANSVVTCNLLSGPNYSWGVLNATAYLTGVAGSIFGQLLAGGQVLQGVIAPELAVKPEIFFGELEKRGIKMEKTIHRVSI
jgi:lysine 6-dehydrogenase